MNPNQLHILQHSFGCDEYGKTTYRGGGKPERRIVRGEPEE